VTYFSTLKMACTEFSSDNNFYIKRYYFILKTVRFFCRTLYSSAMKRYRYLRFLHFTYNENEPDIMFENSDRL